MKGGGRGVAVQNRGALPSGPSAGAASANGLNRYTRTTATIDGPRVRRSTPLLPCLGPTLSSEPTATIRAARTSHAYMQLSQRIFRSRSERMLAGVAGGLATYFD